MYNLEELSIELGNACRLMCIHCSSGSSPKSLPGELDVVDHLRLLAEARELGASVVSFSGGDPLLYKSLVGLVVCAIELGYDRILMYTTGHSYAGDQIREYNQIADLLGHEQLTWIFSLHSHVSAVHDMIMNYPGSWANILESIGWLTGAYSHLEERVEVHMVPMAPNFRDIAAVRNLCKELRVKKLSCLRFVPQTRGKTNFARLAMTKAEFAEMQFLLSYQVGYMADHPVSMRLGCPIDFRHGVGLLDEKAKPCHAGDDLILVRPQGDVHPCAAWKSLPSDSNVKNMTLREIWEGSEVFAGIRQFKKDMSSFPTNTFNEALHQPDELGRYPECPQCSMLNSCLTGCPAQRLHAYGYGDDILDLYVPRSDPLCPRGDGE